MIERERETNGQTKTTMCFDVPWMVYWFAVHSLLELPSLPRAPPLPLNRVGHPVWGFTLKSRKKGISPTNVSPPNNNNNNNMVSPSSVKTPGLRFRLRLRSVRSESVTTRRTSMVSSTSMLAVGRVWLPYANTKYGYPMNVTDHRNHHPPNPNPKHLPISSDPPSTLPRWKFSYSFRVHACKLLIHPKQKQQKQTWIEQLLQTWRMFLNTILSDKNGSCLGVRSWMRGEPPLSIGEHLKKRPFSDAISQELPP